jgi:predicted Abi (CAAX) family protease
MEGKELFDGDFSYGERPTEIEAYWVAVEEARSLGLSEERICQYLRTEWMSNEDLAKLCAAVGVDCGFQPSVKEKPRKAA